MKKSLKSPFNFMTLHNCSDCGALIKQNVVDRKLELPKYCYKCWIIRESARGHLMKGHSRGEVAAS